MKVYAPQISVRLIKAISRTAGLAPGIPAAARYGSLAAFDLTPLLAEDAAIQTSKSVRDPAGGFSITLSDKALSDKKGILDSVYALVEPMDLVEIRFCRDPASYQKPSDRPPLVMRGIVTTVSRSESMQGGRPARSVTIAGQDFGKVLQIMQIYYLYDSGVIASGSNVLSEFAFFAEYASAGAAKIQSAKDFVSAVVSGVINPKLKTMTQFAHGDAVSAKVINQWNPVVTIEGAVEPFLVSSLYNISLHQFLSTLLDVGPFNEMFVEDVPDGINLVVRPAPFIGLDGKLIQGSMPDVTVITDADIIGGQVSRSDQGVANYFWVENARFGLFSNEDQRLLAVTGDASNFVKFDYLNCQSAIYGPRKMEVQSSLQSPAIINSDAPTKDQVPPQTGLYADWLSERRRILAEINKDNVLFESGTLQIKGNERIKAGTYLEVRRANAKPFRFYVVGVNHSFAPFQGFTTSLSLERGTSFVERAKSEQPQYRVEIGAEGVT